MKKFLLLGAALLGLCAVGQTARAGGDDYRDYNNDDDRPAPRHYEGRVVERCYLPPPPTVYFAPPPLPLPPLPFIFGRSYHHRHYYRPHGYGYGYGYRPGVHIGIGF